MEKLRGTAKGDAKAEADVLIDQVKHAIRILERQPPGYWACCWGCMR
jgi:hypothetical protein